MSIIRKAGFLGLGVMLLGNLFAPAPAAADEIDDIISKGSITIAVQTDLPPYGRLGADNQPEGFDVDVAKKLAADLGVKLDLVVITAPAFIPSLLTKKADLVIATKGPSPQRSAAVAFSIPYVGFNNTMVGKKSLSATKIEDIAKYRVGVTRGALTDDIVSVIAPKGTNIMRFEDDSSTNQALLSGQIDLTTTGEAVVQSIIDQNKSADLEIKFTTFTQYGSIAMRRGQPELLRWVNTWLMWVKSTNWLDGTHQKWLNKPMPPLAVY
jgi:polar amino acid transport system substrate-binding protein